MRNSKIDWEISAFFSLKSNECLKQQISILALLTLSVVFLIVGVSPVHSKRVINILDSMS